MHQNKVELIGYYGGDVTHALSAWTSTSREMTGEKKARVGKLLTQLASNGHETPFEKSMLHFLVTTDIATHIQILKHRIGVSVNAESARYKELKDDKFYVPPDWPEGWAEELERHVEWSYSLYHQALADLQPLLGRKRAKESARFFLPYANQIVSDVAFNFRSFYHFLSLRNKADAQKEVRDLAEAMLREVQLTHEFDLTLQAFGLPVCFRVEDVV